ncbi:MAG: hypothetical protein KUG78_17750 [Kangiellaceae bacterium]|nr:hypothetical protein [Kangiellaceae bacterium]
MSFETRPVSFITVANRCDWRIKVYGISAKQLPLPNSLVTLGIERLLPRLPQPAINGQRYGVGFLIIHQGTLRNWFILDWWEQEDIMHHRLFSSPVDDPTNITAVPDTSLIACVHELRVISHESEAWISTVLSNKGEANYDSYLKLSFDSIK